MKPTDRLDATMIVANLLLDFIVKSQFLDDKELETLAEWIKLQEPTCDTNAEKHFLLAARSYILDYNAEFV